MIIFGQTEKGPYRAVNPDCFRIQALSEPPRIKGVRKREPEALLAVVCDGMGGARGGEVASCLASDVFIEKMKQKTAKDALGAMKEALVAANAAVYRRGCEEEALCGMGSTMVAAVAYGEMLAVLSVGDSRIYLWHEGSLVLLTHDHSYVQSMVDAGKMSAEEARYSIHRNIITRAVGTRHRVEGDISYFSWEEGDRLLLCTDGVTGALREEEISAVLSEQPDAKETVQALIDMAIASGSEDNLTALLIENKKENR